jgi:CBS domain-containing protein
VAGKADYLARGLEREGTKAGEARVGDFVRDDVVTCRLDERIGRVRFRIDGSPYGFAFVTTSEGVVLGRLRRSACGDDLERTAEEAMEPGPSTVRPDQSASELRERLERRDLKTAVVTTPEGALIGVVRAADLPASGRSA